MAKKHRFALWSEFKEFITRGSVLDLAVGMIIGAAFTAIVNGLVNYIFKPLINAVPTGAVSGLITVLVARDSSGLDLPKGSSAAADLSKSVYIDWGSFLMAIVNFLLTALVLFFLIKGINAIKNGLGKTKNLLKKGMDFVTGDEDGEEDGTPAGDAPAAPEPAPEPEAATVAPESGKTERLLEEILAEIKKKEA